MTAGLARGEQGPAPGFATVIPRPLAQAPERGAFTLEPSTQIVVRSASPAARRVGELLATSLRPATGFRLPLAVGSRGEGNGDIVLALATGDRSLGDEGYRLVVDGAGVTVTARRPAGLFWGTQTLRQLLPAAIEAGRAPTRAVADPARDGPRPAAVRLARDDARRGAALLRRERCQAADRPHEPLQAQPPPPAPDGRPGMAARDPLMAAACEPRWPDGSGRREGRSLHAAAVRGDRRVRARAVRRGRAGDRHAGARQRRALVLREAELRRRRKGARTRASRSVSRRSASPRS